MYTCIDRKLMHILFLIADQILSQRRGSALMAPVGVESSARGRLLEPAAANITFVAWERHGVGPGVRLPLEFAREVFVL